MDPFMSQNTVNVSFFTDRYSSLYNWVHVFSLTYFATCVRCGKPILSPFVNIFMTKISFSLHIPNSSVN